MIAGIDLGSLYCRTAAVGEDGVSVFRNRYSDRPLPIEVELSSENPVSFRGFKQVLGYEPGAAAGTLEVFRRLAEDVRTNLGQVEGVVIAVPSFFQDRRRAPIREAALDAGFEGVRLIEEPIGVLQKIAQAVAGNVLAYSLGAGCFSATVLQVTDGKPRVLAAQGSTVLGGFNLDGILVNWLFELLGRDPAEALQNKDSLLRIRPLIEQVKIGLSRSEEEVLDVPADGWLSAGQPTMARFSRAGFEDRIQTFVQQTINLTVSAVADAGLDGKAIDHTIMIGGSTRIPLVERRLAELFPKPKRAGDADAAMGAALHGSRLASDEWVRKPPNRPSPPPEEAHRPAPPVARETDKWMELFEPHLRRASAAWKRRSHDEAISAIEDMLGVGRVCLAELYAKRGEDHANAQRYREAVEDYRRALEHNPGDRLVRAACHRALNRYASTLLQQGHLMQAREKIHESLVIEPKCENCRQLGEQIEAAIRQERDRQGYGKKRRR